jgi:hypothetical protein
MAYVTLLYGGNKYLEGILLTGLGLRKQNIKYYLSIIILQVQKIITAIVQGSNILILIIFTLKKNYLK